MRTLRQIKDLINNIAKKKSINPQILLRNYMMERLLERIALSNYKENFILKGGMLISSLIGVESRSTVDMDTTMKNKAVTIDSIKSTFVDIINIDTGDGVKFEIKKVEEIRDEADYPGFRVSIDAILENAKIPIKVDITTGDEITPKEILHMYQLLLEDREIEILSYNIETILAEKLETIITRSTANTRMRDFYDVHILYQLQSESIDLIVLKEALIGTGKKRGTFHVIKKGYDIIEGVFSNENMALSWKKYQKKYSYASDISWEQIGASIRKLWKSID